MLVRVRGKQWYWSYKLTPSDIHKISNLNLIVGSGKTLNNGKGDLIANNYDFKGFNYFVKNKSYQNADTLQNHQNKSNFEIDSTKRFGFLTNIRNLQKAQTEYIPTKPNKIETNFFKKNFTQLPLKVTQRKNLIYPILSENTQTGFKNKDFSYRYFNFNYQKLSSALPSNFNWKSNFTSFLTDTPSGSRTSESGLSLWQSDKFRSQKTLILRKNPLNDKNSLLKFVLDTKTKENYRRHYATLKQEIRKDPRKIVINNELDLNKANLLKTNEFTHYKINELSKSSYTLKNNKRLLDTISLLVLPTKTNLTFITNSFDVVHSWFVPGLGLKMDCVPGRSTHHSMYVKVPGFYYGQCAEICGRLHHHMPIKVCFLPIEHFLVW